MTTWTPKKNENKKTTPSRGNRSKSQRSSPESNKGPKKEKHGKTFRNDKDLKEFIYEELISHPTVKVPTAQLDKYSGQLANNLKWKFKNLVAK